jgi:hypothetical protein
MFDKLFKRRPVLDWSSWNENEIRAYLHKGGDPNLKDPDGGTPLIQAVAIGSLSLVKELLDKGVDVNAATNDGTPTIIYAIVSSSRNKVEILAALLQKQVNINTQERDGTTPLMFALLSNQTEVAKLLIAHHADIKLRDNKGRLALDFAETMGNIEIIPLLKKIMSM